LRVVGFQKHLHGPCRSPILQEIQIARNQTVAAFRQPWCDATPRKLKAGSAYAPVSSSHFDIHGKEKKTMGDPIVIIPPGGFSGGWDPCPDSLGSGYSYCGFDGDVQGGAAYCCPA
jgi:hypothetical protein